MKEVPANKVCIVFVCDECDATIDWPVSSLDDGTPTCEVCQRDMKVGDKVMMSVTKKSNLGGNGTPKLDFGRGKTGDLPVTYAEKFENFILMCADQKRPDGASSGISSAVVMAPWVLGDTQDEIRESLSRLSLAGLGVICVQSDILSINGVVCDVQGITKEDKGAQCGCSDEADYEIDLVRNGHWKNTRFVCLNCLAQEVDGGC